MLLNIQSYSRELHSRKNIHKEYTRRLQRIIKKNSKKKKNIANSAHNVNCIRGALLEFPLGQKLHFALELPVGTHRASEQPLSRPLHHEWKIKGI